MRFDRRKFLKTIPLAGLTLAGCTSTQNLTNNARTTEQTKPKSKEQGLPPCRAITDKPNHHWFGYYDKLQFDPTCRYVLGMEVKFEHRSPRADDEIKVGMVDLRDNDRWIELGSSKAWNWQQGCMLQWIPGSDRDIIWNDRQDGQFVSHILDVKSGRRRTIGSPVYALSPDGKTAITPDFRRIQDMRPGYGYAGITDPYKDALAPTDSGIWRVDLETGKRQFIVPIADIAKIPWSQGDISDAKHYFNHLLFNTDGSRFVFLHRWRQNGGKFITRMVTANPDGSDTRVIEDSGSASHFIWRDPENILVWTWYPSHKSAFYLVKDEPMPAEHKLIGANKMPRNGHCTYLPGNEWILNDTYPDDKRRQHPYLYNVETHKKVSLGHFYLPPEYRGEERIDTHPRFSPDGKMICIDSAHGGKGRQLYLIDISGITG